MSAVPLTEFEPEALRACLQDATWLETMVRWHQGVVESYQRERGVLPAKFGRIYARLEDLMDALGRVHDALLVQLERVEGCEEWGVRLYVDRSTIQQRVKMEDSGVQQLQRELASARPGRAYFLQRKMADALSAATNQFLSDLAQTGYDHLLRCAVAGQVSPRPSAQSADDGCAEILRAAFLVPRSRADGFVPEINRLMEGQEGLRCEYNGPWPPYSFASLDEEGPR